MRKFFLIPLLACFSCVMAWGTNPTSISELQQAVTDAPANVETTITLGGNIDGGLLTGQVALTIPANKIIVLDLNGHNLTAQLKTTTESNYPTTQVIRNLGTLTITDGVGGGKIENTYKTISGTNSYDCTRVIQNNSDATLHLVKCIIKSDKMGVDNRGGSITIEADVTIEVAENSNSTLINAAYNYSNGGVALAMREGSSGVINGGHLKSFNFPTIQMVEDATLEIHGGTFEGVEGFGWVADYGMTSYSNLQVSGGTFDFDPSAFVAQDAYYVEESAGVFEVHQLGEPVYRSVGTLAEMQAALDASSNEHPAVMTLFADIVLSESFTLPHGAQMIVPEGRTFTVADGGLFVNEGLTKVAGTIAIRDAGFFSKPANVEYEGSGAMELAGYSLTEVNNVIQYVISTPMQLQYLSYLTLQDAYQDKTWNISLSTDINLPSNVNFEPISYINGVFDGQKHFISCLYMRTSMEQATLFKVFRGTARNLTIKNINIGTIVGSASGFCGILKKGSILENITLQGAINSDGGNVCGYVITCENLGSDATGSEMKLASDKILFVNCVNDIDIYTGGEIDGAFIGSVSGTKGVFGFYNCSNKGSIRGVYAGELLGHGNGNKGAKLELVAFTPSNEITELKGSGTTKCGIAHLLGTSDITLQYTSDYTEEYDPSKYTAIWDGEKYVAVEASAINNTGAATIDWKEETTWTEDGGITHDVVPTEADNVTVNNTVVVYNGTDAVANSVAVAEDKTLTINEGGSLTIGEGGLTIAAGATVTVKEGATLVVGKDGISGTGNLVIEANQANGTGVVLFDPEADVTNTRVPASIQITPNAHKKGENSLLYRYIGIPLYFKGTDVFEASNFSASDPAATIYFQEWDPQNGWNNLTQWSALVPFKGYATSNNTVNDLTYTFTGNLVGNAPRTLNFNYGFNMYANSYTAPIQIETLLNGLSNNVNLTIYMFDDGVVKSVSKSAFYGFEDPEFTSIPAMQAFFILMENEGTHPTESINYAAAVFNNNYPNGGLYAPKRVETPVCNRVRINVTAENGASDAAYLIEAADFTNDFENGYDAVKYMNEGLNLYATTAHGRQTSTYSNDIEGTFIGVQGNGTYTMSFDKVAGEEYQIRDLQTNAVVTMSDANTYTFTANGTNDARFVVEPIAKMPTAVDNVSEAKMFINNNTLYISENNTNANIMIYAANGQLVLNEVAQPTISLNGLASGVYTVRVANKTLKFVK